MKKLLGILTVVLFANQAGAIDISTFETELSGDQQAFYLGGIGHGLTYANAANRANGYPEIICFPQGVSVNPDLMKAAMFDQDDKSMQVTAAIYLGLYKMFPCN